MELQNSTSSASTTSFTPLTVLVSTNSNYNSLIIPPPISVAPPTEADLQRDACFLEDFRNGFLSRGVPCSMFETVKQQRQDLIIRIKSVLLQFVKDTYYRSSTTTNNNKNQSSSLFEESSSSSPFLWADVRPYGSVAIEADLIDSDVDLYEFLNLPGISEKPTNQAM